MNSGTIFCTVFAATFALSACKPSAPHPEIFKTQTDALEKAKGVEKQLQQSEEQRRAAEEEQQK
ncbi:putative lipoprotein [Collimonas arenae]|uniref:Putative lipoprotein n=1 Tax=Collimonas arenae TaxID=279058 RepID=A0A127PTC8_9BURK|nr:hypothetical protein [Collimonas arenae]AMP01016.1 putative lipoprotein [Collimonas arenae]AMP10908.1 putative lipoprotein [Collimonas arenae]